MELLLNGRPAGSERIINKIDEYEKKFIDDTRN